MKTTYHTKLKASKETNKETDEKEAENEEAKEESESIPEFTEQEVQAAIDSLKKGISGDSNGIKADDFKGSDEETKKIR